MNKYKLAISKMMSAITVAIIIIAAIVAGVLVYQYTLPKPSSDVYLTVLTVSGARFETVIRGLLPSFLVKYPNIHVAIETVGMGELLTEKGPLELSSRKGAYDIVCMDGIFTTVYAEAGWTVDLTDWILSSDPNVAITNFETNFPNNIRYYTMKDIAPGSTKNGRYYAITCDNNCYLSFFRKSVFNQLGITYANITTFEGALKVYEALNASGYKIEMSLRSPIWSAAQYQNLLWSAGGQIWNEQTFEPELTTLYSKAALEVLKEEFQFCIPGCTTYSDPEIIDTWLREEAVYMPHEWGNPVFTDSTYSTFANDTDCTQMVPKWAPNWRYAGLGTTKAARVTTVGIAPTMGGLPYVVDSASKHPYEAYLLLRWLMIPENGNAYVANTGQTGNMAILTDPAVQALHPYFKGLATNMPNAVYRGGVAEYMEIDTIVAREVNRYLIGEISLDTCMNNMQSDVRAVFATAGYYSGKSSAEITQSQIDMILNKALEYRQQRLAGLVDPNVVPWISC